ncbi:MAG: hypothetical protein LC130_01390, partial [Bryobacterales bacterium]|nr:hypothetical protein [Bryobacterales bacterium]
RTCCSTMLSSQSARFPSIPASCCILGGATGVRVGTERESRSFPTHTPIVLGGGIERAAQHL